MGQLVLLFLECFKIGLVSVGGGPATLPYLMELTETRNWFTMMDLTNMIAVSESTPGPLGLNMATYAGFMTAGVIGGTVSTIGIVVPSIIIICLIGAFLENFNENRFVKSAFSAIRPAVCGIIGVSACHVCRVCLFIPDAAGKYILQPKTAILSVAAFILFQNKRFKKVHPAIWFLIAAVCGIVFRF